MEDSILNSLLRYSRQVTPSRETYPIPYYGWTSDLRKSTPHINLSTYYLLDNPLVSSKPSLKLTSCMSTAGLSPQKAMMLVKTPQNRQKKSSIGYSKNVKEAELEIKKIVEKEKMERAKFARQQKVFEVIEKRLCEKNKKKNLKLDKEDCLIDEEVDVNLVGSMKEEIKILNEQLLLSNQKIKALQEKND